MEKFNLLILECLVLKLGFMEVVSKLFYFNYVGLVIYSTIISTVFVCTMMLKLLTSMLTTNSWFQDLHCTQLKVLNKRKLKVQPELTNGLHTELVRKLMLRGIQLLVGHRLQLAVLRLH